MSGSLDRRVRALERMQGAAEKWPSHITLATVDEDDTPEAVEAARRVAQDAYRAQRGLPASEEIGVILMRIVRPKHGYDA